MTLVSQPLDKQTLVKLRSEYGDYFKVTVDIAKETLVAGGELHADGEKLLLENGARQDDVWGGGINAVLNLRPRLKNTSLEILDLKTREKFISIVKKIFATLWD